MQEIIKPYSPALRNEWINGILEDTWFLEYSDAGKELFSYHDLCIVKRQKPCHFYEWLAAITIFKESGYLSIQEKYQFKSDEESRNRFLKFAPQKVLDFFNDPENNISQGPDLFVYHPTTRDWYFCEVKGERDRIGKNQKIFFPKIEKEFGKQIIVIRFQPEKD